MRALAEGNSILEPHPREGLDCPTMPTGMTDEAWIMEALLRYRVPHDFHAQFDQ